MPTALRTLRYRDHYGMTRYISALVGTACLTLTAGCSLLVGTGMNRAADVNTLMLYDNANGKTVHVHVGNRVDLQLASSYWTVNGSSDSAVLRQDGDTTALPRPTDCPAIPGLGCVPVRTDFSAVKPGTAVISADRLSCGEAMRCGPNQEHFAVTVVVDSR